MPDKFELAKSNRSTCKKCKEKIMKDVVRFGEESVFVRDGNEIRSFRWYHFDCALDKFKERVLEVEEGNELLNEEQTKELTDMRNKLGASEFDFKSIADLSGDEGIANIKGSILRVMNPRDLTNTKGEVQTGRIVYVEDEHGNRGKAVVFSDLDLKKASPILMVNCHVRLGGDDKAEVVEGPKTKIYFDKSKVNVTVTTKYISQAWERPKNIFCVFEIAPTSRASCVICEERITKGDLKLIKAVWGENEKTKAKYPRKNSYHPICALEDDDAEEFIYEAVTRLSPDFISENLDELNIFKSKIKNLKREYELLSNLIE